MDSVQVKDKNFQIYIQEEKIISRVSEVAAQISRDLADKKPLFLAVLNGSFVFAADLMRSVSIPCEISFVRMSSYSGTQSTGKVKELLGLKENIEGRTVVVVEDIIDSLKAKHPAELHVASLLVKPNNLKVDLDISYRCFDIPNDFIVGYGLDYDGEGRNLRDIYVVQE